jgi:AI-2 transport protein TqsA
VARLLDDRQPVADVPAGDQPEMAAWRSGGWRTANTALLTAAAVVIVVAGMRAAAGILVPFMLAVFVAVICAPLLHGMRRHRVPTSLSIIAILLVMLAAIVVFVGAVERAIRGFTQKLPEYQVAFQVQTDRLWLWLEDLGIEVPDDALPEMFNLQAVLGHLGTIASTLGDLLTTTFIIVIVAIFILLESAALPDKMRLRHGLSSAAWLRIRQIVADVRRYMFLKTVMSLFTGALVALGLLLLGVDFPILLGTIAFALNYIPTIGSIVAAVPGVLLAFVEFGLGTGAITALGYLVVNIGISNGIEPRYFGQGLGLSPLVVILSVLFWGWVLGPMGMLVSVPLTMSVKIALESDEHTRWLAVLMGGRPKQRLGGQRKLAPTPAETN